MSTTTRTTCIMCSNPEDSDLGWFDDADGNLVCNRCGTNPLQGTFVIPHALDEHKARQRFLLTHNGAHIVSCRKIQQTGRDATYRIVAR